ncbi:MAG: sulfatase [Daejeonella sp.]
MERPFNIIIKLLLLCSVSLVFFAPNSIFAQNHPVVSKPNILWLIAEDISPFLSSYGDSTAKTPNLDRLASEGVRYTNVFSVSGVCAPSRSCLITGMYPTSIGTNNMRTLNVASHLGIPKYSVVLPSHVKMFSELMRKEGYYCTNNSKQDYQFVAPRSGWDESSTQAHWKKRPKDKPFFSVFTFNVTHESQIWEKRKDPLLVDPDNVNLPPYYPDTRLIREDVARMYSNIMEMDKQVGILLNQLENEGLLENTIVLWFSDNGGPLPRGKREVYDSGLRIPLLIRFPDKKLAGTVSSQLISFVDFAPTTLSLASISIPSYMQGQAFSGASKAESSRKYIHAARDRMDTEYDMVRAVRDERYKYVKNFQPEKPYLQNIIFRQSLNVMKELHRLNEENKLNAVQQLWFRKSKDPEELFDTKTDPFELENLALNPRYGTKLKELRNELERWMKYTGDKGFIPEKQWIASFWPDLKQPITSDPAFKVENGLLSLSSATRGASLSYKIPDVNQDINAIAWQLYTNPLRLKAGQKVFTIAERIGYQESRIKEFTIPN